MSTTIERGISTGVIGQPIDRVDGPLKVTGAARYAADAPVAVPLYAVIVQSTVPNGRITSIDERATRAVPNVVDVITYRNAPRVVTLPFEFMVPFVEDVGPFQSDTIHYDGEHVAAVVARTLEAAREGAALLRITYEPGPAHLTIDDAPFVWPEESFGRPAQLQRGLPEAAYSDSDVKIDVTYETPIEHHNPIEPSATVAEWRDDEIVVYDATQWVLGTRVCVAKAFGVQEERIRVISPFVGGGFGCKGFFWAHPVIAVMAAKATGRPVKLVLTRQQMFTSCGYRSMTRQRTRLGASRDGRLNALMHDVTAVTSEVGTFIEIAGVATPMLFDIPNLAVTHRLAKLAVPTPNAMRAPGEAPGSFALGCAMDEIAVACGLDPLDVLRRNHADVDPESGRPFSSKHLLQCYARGAEAFGWNRRPKEPHTMRDGDDLIGWGVATAVYPALRAPSEARVTIEPDGAIDVASATHDLGTGQYTILAQIAAEILGVDPRMVRVRMGDSEFPNAPVAGGSQSAASVGPAVLDGAMRMLRELKRIAAAFGESPLYGLLESEIEARDGMLRALDDPSRAITFADVVGLAGTGAIEILAQAAAGAEENAYAFYSFGAHFVEVRVDEDFGLVRVSRTLSVMDCGRVLNAKTARSQILGGVVMGIGMALYEETVRDPRYGAIVTNNLADYRVPVNADIRDMDVQFIEEPDIVFNPLGARGIGEIGITGVAAAIANAVWHATGVRVRDLPIVAEKLLLAPAGAA